MLSIQQAITSVNNTPLPYGIFKLLQTNTLRVVVTHYTIEPNILFSMNSETKYKMLNLVGFTNYI